jgi:hypothetical protein
VQDHVVALLRFIGSVNNLSLLTIGGYYYYNSHAIMMEEEMVTMQGYGMSIGGCNMLCSASTRHGLVVVTPQVFGSHKLHVHFINMCIIHLIMPLSLETCVCNIPKLCLFYA